MVLNLQFNPIANHPEFIKIMKQMLPKLMLINPENISKVSCFEKFKDLAFMEKAYELEGQTDSSLPTPRSGGSFTLIEGVRI